MDDFTNQTPLVTSENATFDERYRLLRTIGRGRSSIVFQALTWSNGQLFGHLSTGKKQELAIKIITATAAEREHAIKGLKLEAACTLALNHENIIRIYDYVTSRDPCYITMEYLDAGDLRTMLVLRGKPLSLLRTLRIIRQALNGLDYLHNLGILHRDIKPENILLSTSGIVKIADFGTALMPFQPVPQIDIARGVGTFDYLAPEVFLGRGICEASDLYSLAVTAFQLIAGELPFSGDGLYERVQTKVAGTWTPLHHLLPQAPKSLENFFNCALSPEPYKRFQSASEFRRALDLCAEEIRAKDWSLSQEETEDLLPHGYSGPKSLAQCA